MKNRFLLCLLILVLGVVPIAGCEWFEEDEEVTLKGDTGDDCDHDSDCRSERCGYPGICE